MNVIKTENFSRNVINKLNPIKKDSIKILEETFFKFDTPMGVLSKDVFQKQKETDTIANKITELFY